MTSPYPQDQSVTKSLGGSIKKDQSKEGSKFLALELVLEQDVENSSQEGDDARVGQAGIARPIKGWAEIFVEWLCWCRSHVMGRMGWSPGELVDSQGG